MVAVSVVNVSKKGRKSMGFKITGRYRNNDYEDLDTADTKEDAEFLKAEYKMAFGSEWLIKVEADR